MLGLDPAQFVQQRVVAIVPKLGVVENVVAIAVVLQEPPQLTRARGGVRGGAQLSTSSAPTSSAAGCISRARS